MVRENAPSGSCDMAALVERVLCACVREAPATTSFEVQQHFQPRWLRCPDSIEVASFSHLFTLSSVRFYLSNFIFSYNHSRLANKSGRSNSQCCHGPFPTPLRQRWCCEHVFPPFSEAKIYNFLFFVFSFAFLIRAVTGFSLTHWNQVFFIQFRGDF